MEIKRIFAQRLREQRTLRGLPQKELADMLNVGATNVNNWEAGLHLPQVEILCKIANILDVSIDYLFGQTENPKRSQ